MHTIQQNYILLAGSRARSVRAQQKQKLCALVRQPSGGSHTHTKVPIRTTMNNYLCALVRAKIKTNVWLLFVGGPDGHHKSHE